jgi:hypothetical protein
MVVKRRKRHKQRKQPLHNARLWQIWRAMVHLLMRRRENLAQGVGGNYLAFLVLKVLAVWVLAKLCHLS